jgi:hypothetical protein
MKKIILLFGLMFIIFAGCSKKEDIKLSTAGSNAFALDMGKGWEVQAITELHGFDLSEKDGEYFARVFYAVDIITPDNKTIRSLFTKENDKKDSEEIKSLKLEAQFNIDGDYPVGNYKAVFNIKDMVSNKTLKDTVGFVLQK